MTQQELKTKLAAKWYARAKEAGSSATTHKGIMRYLRAKGFAVRVTGYAIWLDPLKHYGAKAMQHTAPRRVTRLHWMNGRRGERIMSAAGLWAKDDAIQLAAELDTKLGNQIAARIFYPYRRSSSQWAGGEHSTEVIISDQPSAECTTTRVWSDNGKWSGTNSSATFCMTRRCAHLFPSGMAAGLVVVDAEQLGPREYRMTWVEQSTGVSLKTVDGYYIRGRHVQARTLEAARKKAAKMRSDAVEATLQRRQWIIERRHERRALSNVWVEMQDSLAVGNCRAASELLRQQAARLLGAKGEFALRADVLLSLRNDSYARRAVAHAQNRNQAVAA